MKTLLIPGILVLVCLILFLAGVISPRRSKKMQAKVDDLSRKGERGGEENAGRVGDLTRRGLEKSRDAADASANGGRRVNEAVRESSD